MRNFYLISMLLMSTIFMMTACTPMKSEGYSFIASDVEFGEEDYQKIVSSNNSLGFDLLKKVDPDEQDNIFISPTSLMMALSMVYNGAEGVTKEEIGKVLRVEGIAEDELNQANASLGTKLYKDTDQVITHIANSIWLHEDYQFEEEFAAGNQDYYNTHMEEINPLDEKSTERINHWVQESTDHKITEMVNGPLDRNMAALLINALYFKGEWTYEFDQDKTDKGNFHLLDGTIKEVDQMSLQADLLYVENEHFQAVQLPYGDGEVSMELFLPKEGVSKQQLVETVTLDHWQQWNEEFINKEGTVILPKFTMTYETSLNKPLMDMGMNEAFQPNDADFSKMIQEEEQIYVNEVQQKTFIEVNEKGTEAAGATSIEMKTVSAPVDGPFHMDVNRPFMFTITDEETGAILFMGVIANPQAA